MEFRDIAWNISEAEYRADKALSYSTLARFSKEGFSKLDSLFDFQSTPALTFGSMVDCLVTECIPNGNDDIYNNRYKVITASNISDSKKQVLNIIFGLGKTKSLLAYTMDEVIPILNNLGYQQRWKDETRYKSIMECSSYYNLLLLAKDKTLVQLKDDQDAKNCRDALLESPSTKEIFAENSPFDSVKTYYQLKFKSKYEGVEIRSMADIIRVDYENKIVYPIDLKTSGHPEYEFVDSFIKWRYMIQAQLYWYNIRTNMDKSSFKDYKLAPYRFVVVNRYTLCPLVFIYEDSMSDKSFVYKDIVIPNWRSLLLNLNWYLCHPKNKVPIGISTIAPNSIDELMKVTD